MQGVLNPAFLQDPQDPAGFVSVSIISLHVGGEVLKGVVTGGVRIPSSEGPPQGPSSGRVRTYLGVAGCLLEALVLSGSIFGWASMMYVLEKDGIYGDLCHKRLNTDDTVLHAAAQNTSVATGLACPEQSMRLSLAFTIGMGLFGFGVFPMGVFFDRFGLRITRLLCMNASLVSQHARAAFMHHADPMGLTLLRGVNDDPSSIPKWALSGSMGLFSFMLIGCTTKEWPWLCLVGGSVLGLCCSSLVMIHANVALLAGPRKSTLSGMFIGLLNTAFTFQVVKMAQGMGFDRKSCMLVFSAFWVIGVPTSWLLPYNKIRLHPPQKEMVEHLVTGDGRSLKDCVISKSYFLFLIWFAVLHACWQLHTNGYNLWVTHIVAGDDAKVSFLTDFQAWSLLSALILAPLSGMIIDYTQAVIDPSATSLESPVAVAPCMLVACMSALCMMVASLWSKQEAIFACMVLFVLGKSFMYTSLVSYLSYISPSKYFGILFGITYAVGGLAGVASHPYLIWARNSSRGFEPCHVFILCTVVASFACPVWCIYSHTRKSNRVSHSTTITTKM